MAAIKQIPLSVLLSFPPPNYEDPETHGDGLVIVNSIFIALVTICVALRLYTRLFIKRWFGIDDWFIILAWIFTMATDILVIVANQNYYWDRHIWDIPLSDSAGNLKVALASTILFTCAASSTRISLVCFYYRLVREVKRPLFRWALHLTLGYCVAVWITFVFTSCLQCV
ncbi:MAG: hypothetical protein INR71_15485 [Terriglobus roseus]|nr:hypothetical protein [Terriglobus roseus]